MTVELRNRTFSAFKLAYICFGIALLVSCANHKATTRLSPRANYERMLAIREGMTKKEVRNLLGPPNEVRAVDKENLLDGVACYSSREPQVREAYRWAYGPSIPHAFATGGVVAFDTRGLVICAASPISANGFIELPREDRVVPSRNGLSCLVDQVRFEEKRGQFPGAWLAKVTIKNGSGAEYARRCYVNSIARLCAVEIYDKGKVLIFREDRSEIQNGYAEMSSTYSLADGASNTEEVPLMPNMLFGPLPPGVYFVRVCFRDQLDGFIASSLYEVLVSK